MVINSLIDIKMKFSKNKAKEYLEKHGLVKYLIAAKSGQLKPDYRDLARLHQLAVARKVFTILEFGIGWSTIILADALRTNEEKWKKSGIKENFRVNNPFKIFSVDSSKKWINVVSKQIPRDLKRYIEISYSDAEAGTFDGRICHFYKRIPDIVPDFVYLDGPDPADVKGNVNGLTWKNPERTVMSGDILFMEPTFLPGTFIIIDGRTNNARFLENNLQRNWVVKHDKEEDVTTMEFVEKPLGKINERKMSYCLGS